ncbi:unnamed protein product [Sphagnum troendelagicum]|uniref:Uncharacterized protein n=1 Tax=Sphagnum troendelagicum TaxID=128251 RepID=A0ABP0TGI9_9BRYO
MNKVVSSSSCVQATAMGAIAGRATRACDMCGIQRARWYCAADEAYLCARCDTSVHGANTLALRHDRICLAPTHLHGFTPSAGGSLQQKAAFKLRSTTTTSRSSTIPSKTASKNGDGVSEPDESPAAAAAYTARAQQEEEIKTFSSSSKDQQLQQLDSSSSKADESGASTEFESATEFEGFRSPDFGPRDIMCDEFGLDFDFPVPGSSESEVYCDEAHGAPAMGATVRTVAAAAAAAPQLSHETASPFAKFLPRLPRKIQEGRGERRERVKKEAEEILRCSLEELSKEELQQVPCLRLDFQEVLNAWSDGTTTATDGEADFDRSHGGSEAAAIGGIAAAGEDVVVGRQARVLRYKEKRLTRLFSKTIRYQVRKLNAERRPRMKGRFVKRTSVNS